MFFLKKKNIVQYSVYYTYNVCLKKKKNIVYIWHMTIVHTISLANSNDSINPQSMFH